MVTVADLVASPALALEPVALPHPGLTVRWVATSELVDPTPYLEGGEVLLTTGLGTASWTATEWAPYVDRLARAGVVALGLATGLTHATAPPELVATCGERALNLLAVPRATAFVTVSRTAAELLEAERGEAARRALDRQHALTQAALDEDDLAAVATELARVLGGATLLLTADRGVRLGPVGPLAGDLDVAAVQREATRMRSHGLRTAASLSGPTATTMVRPLGVRGRPEGYLAVLVPGRPDEVDRTTVGTAAALVSLALERRRDRRATDRGLRERALQVLLSGDARTARMLLAATSGGGSLTREVQVLRATGSPDALEDARARWEDERLVVCVAEPDALTVVAPARRAVSVAEELASGGLRVGIGSATSLDDARTGHVTATQALAETTAAAPTRSWADLTGGGVVGLLGPERAAQFGRTYLAPLADHEELLRTLAAFLRHHGSRAEVAAELGVHRNTVRNRVEQVERLLGASLDDPQTRADAWVALQSGR